MKAEIVVGIVYDTNQILIVKRKVPEESLIWQFPGGYILKDESEKEAVIRKVKVETGCDVNAIKCLGIRQHPDTKVAISYWACKYTRGSIDVKDEDISEAKWIKISELADYLSSIFEPVIEFLNQEIQ